MSMSFCSMLVISVPVCAGCLTVSKPASLQNEDSSRPLRNDGRRAVSSRATLLDEPPHCPELPCTQA